jgi:hypothetical protein
MDVKEQEQIRESPIAAEEQIAPHNYFYIFICPRVYSHLDISGIYRYYSG